MSNHRTMKHSRRGDSTRKGPVIEPDIGEDLPVKGGDPLTRPPPKAPSPKRPPKKE